jgi:predicted ATPase
MRPYGPLRGRDQELARALGIVRRTRVHGASGVVLITGERGIGKTALLSEICRQAAHGQRRHQLALKYFRELRSVTGDSYLAEEIMQLQLLDRYDDAQMLLDAAHEDSHAKAESLRVQLVNALRERGELN